MATREVRACDFCKRESPDEIEAIPLRDGLFFDACTRCIDEKHIASMVEVAQIAGRQEEARSLDRAYQYNGQFYGPHYK